MIRTLIENNEATSRAQPTVRPVQMMGCGHGLVRLDLQLLIEAIIDRLEHYPPASRGLEAGGLREALERGVSGSSDESLISTLLGRFDDLY